MAVSGVAALAFDLDGTLVDSAADLQLALNLTLRELQLPQCSRTEVESWIGNGIDNLVLRGLSHSRDIDVGLPDSLIMQAQQRFRAHYAKVLCEISQLYPGVNATLERLSGRGWPMAVITNKSAQFTHIMLERLGIASFFRIVICGDQLTQKKPHPAPLHYAAEQMQLPVERMLMVGDSKNDILAAKAAGSPSVGLTYGYNYGEDIALCEPTFTLSAFSDLLAILPAEPVSDL